MVIVMDIMVIIDIKLSLNKDLRIVHCIMVNGVTEIEENETNTYSYP